ncbi:MAG TPA: trehalose-6-phosphate synthase [Xanthobacteraceae bacterium]|nr:trehalose-6-phosphate synthase [Xanthobacteraceae bacterium]
MTVIVVSNRIALPQGQEPVSGGLAAALLPAVKNSGAIWVGSSGREVEFCGKDALAEIHPHGAGAIATVDMPAEHYQRFYEGFSNSVLWPALHSRMDLVRAAPADYASYREVNAFMARALLRFYRPDAAFWVHDYHFLLLAQNLRESGIARPIGFFLHTPFPSHTVFASVPQHRDLAAGMLCYDLIGFQTDDDAKNFAEYITREFELNVDESGIICHRGGTTRLASFPVGIDVAAFAEQAMKAAARPAIAHLRGSLQGRKLAIGVDRLDYSKGIPHRFQAIDRLFERHPPVRRTLSLLQIAVPTRDRIPAYQQLKAEIAALVGEINGRHADVDWTPIRYLNKSFPQDVLAGFYRSAQLGLVTPLQDGMNLVAKEYVAAQNPLDPGVLILSEFAGAAKQLDAALLVNPHDLDAVVDAIMRGLAMPIAERRQRWASMITRMEASALDAWFSDFVTELTAVRRGVRRPPLAMPAASAASVALRSAAVSRH